MHRLYIKKKKKVTQPALIYYCGSKLKSWKGQKKPIFDQSWKGQKFIE